MVGADHQEGRTEERVRARREHGDVLAPAALEVEEDGRAFAPSDPVALHGLRRLRPVECVERVEQFLRVAGDLDPPLAEIAGLHQRVAALAAALLHLLVGEHGEARRTPVDRAFAPLDEPGVEEPHEQPLGPSVVRGFGCVDLVAPVEHRADARELVLAEVCDRAAHDHRGMLADLHRVVLGVDAEGIEPHRLEDGVPHEAPPPAVDVAAREGNDVPDVEPLSGGVREHHQVVEGSVGHRRAGCGSRRAHPRSDASVPRPWRGRRRRAGPDPARREP